MSIISSVPEARRELERAPLDLDAFIRLVNELLPRFLAPENADKALVSVRLARYFQTNGLLDEPFKLGREARYGARHLLQLLAVRRLMAQGYSTNSLSNLLRGASNDALQRLIEGETPSVESAVATPAQSNDALDFLSQVRRRSAPAPASSPAPSSPAPTSQSSWTRSEVAPGLEIHLSANFQTPQSPHEWDVLIEALRAAVQGASPSSAKKRRR